MSTDVDVTVVGAGPYGLSIASHLSKAGVDYRIFGRPMQTWSTAMPRGMFLKSEGFASSLYDPGHAFALRDYCRENGLDYADIGLPVPLDQFTAYGQEFQRRFVPDLDERRVDSVVSMHPGFALVLEDGEVVTSRRVVLAIGITYFDYSPPVLDGLPPELASHSSAHVELDRFAGQEVALIGAGSSAVDLGVLLHEAGASASLIVRNSFVDFHDQPVLERSLLTRIRRPLSCIGQDWRRRVFTDAPLLFHALPESVRHHEIGVTMTATAGWFVHEPADRVLTYHLNREVAQAEPADGRLRLTLKGPGDGPRTIEVDHVIAATGYDVDIDRLGFLDPAIRSSLATTGRAPALSSNFESSLPGLYFVGVASMNAFGPVFRFACGAEYTANRIARHLAASASPAASHLAAVAQA